MAHGTRSSKLQLKKIDRLGTWFRTVVKSVRVKLVVKNLQTSETNQLLTPTFYLMYADRVALMEMMKNIETLSF